ncbi:MAG TPA: ATP-dependent helicase [Allosphingosinicella sp.]|nr:ATP-dependent helicase [Allosphingosinicella sp.]
MAVLARRVRPEDWRSIGVDELEPNAMAVVRSADNRSVIAGPGAGKTELLAQRAAYLLQTGAAPPPQRILAISFKRDAATNLAARVRKRCHPSHAARLDSLTFDAFAKGLVDRFGQALPDRWRPRFDYEIMWTNDDLYRGFLTQQVGAPPQTIGTYADLQAISVKKFERDLLLGAPLPIDGWTSPTPGLWAADRFWQTSLHSGSKSRLSFPMIGRLAELLLRLNPMVRDALRLTYSHLFMDEFQDTTHVQYDLVRTIFAGTEAIVTAVGDNKQQIMRWAMAMADPFAALAADFNVTRTQLLNNYRSSPGLVQIQHVLARALDPHAAEPISKTKATVGGDSCIILDFSTPHKEAEKLAGLVRSEMEKHGLTPRDFVLLVRQRADKYAAVLEPAFRAAGVPLRNEADSIGAVQLQDLLADGASDLLVAVLRLAMTARAGRFWTECQDALGALYGVAPDDEAGRTQFARQLDAFVLDLKRQNPKPPASTTEARSIVGVVLDFIGRDRLLAAHPAYAQGGWFAKLENAMALHLEGSSDGAANWAAALDAYEGLHSVPLMTIHKSKGLEYHTVIFVGLDDSAWARSFKEDQTEATAGFFVAFTRAKQRVLFTYCAQRGAKDTINSFYQLLLGCGVKIIFAG